MSKTVVLFRGSCYTDDSQKVILPPITLISLAPMISPSPSIILDGNVKSEEDCFLEIKESLDSTLCIGISAITGPEVASGLKFAALIRDAAPQIPIVWGGWHVSCLPDESIQNQYVDALIIGPGQMAFTEIIKRISNGEAFNNIEGVLTEANQGQTITASQTGKFNLTNCPLPAFDMLDLEFYRRESLAILPYPEINGLKLTGYLYYVTSFGCPFSCTFCSNNLVYKHRWYGYSVDAVLDHLGWLVTEKGFNCIAIIDAEFFFKNDRIEYFCDGIVKRGYKFVWDAQASVKSILRMAKKGLLSKLHKAGCWRMNIGAETGSREMLEYINKKISVEDILESARILKDSGITACFNLLFGLLHEKRSDLLDSFSMAYQLKKINPDTPLPISFYTPFPGTPMYEDAVNSGFNVPGSLEEWGSYKTSYITLSDNIPWRDVKREKLIYDVLTFYLPISVPGNLKRGTITMYKQKLEKSSYRFLLYLATRIANYRMKNMEFRFRIEIFLYGMYCRLTNTQDYRSGKSDIDDN